MTLSQFGLIHAPMAFGGFESEPEVTRVKILGHKVKRWPFPNFGWFVLLWGLGASKAYLRSPRSKSEDTSSKDYLFPILPDSCSPWGSGVLKVNLRSPRSKSEVTWSKMTFSQFGWFILIIMGSRGLKSESEVNKVKTTVHMVQKWPFLNFGWSVLSWGPGSQKRIWVTKVKTLGRNVQKLIIFSQFWQNRAPLRFEGLKIEPELTRTKKRPFLIFADSCCYGVQGLKSESEVTKVKTWGYKVKNGLSAILADSCSYGVCWPQKWIWGHRGQNLRSIMFQPLPFVWIW